MPMTCSLKNAEMGAANVHHHERRDRSGIAGGELRRARGLSTSPSFRIETPAGLSHGRNFFDPDIFQIARVRTQRQIYPSPEAISWKFR
jgi:hypothetical protein